MPPMFLLNVYANRDTMDEEFQALIDYFEHKLLVKTIMGLKVQRKEK
jgi:hypothetical protein